MNEKTSKVAIVKGDDIVEMLLKSIDLLRLKWNLCGKKVFLKPNLKAASTNTMKGATTSIDLIKTLVQYLQKANAIPIIGEGTTSRYITEEALINSGIKEFGERNGIEILNLNDEEKIIMDIPGGVALKNIKISKKIFECDYLINIPVMKTHMMTDITLGMKNLMGLIADKDLHKLHINGIHESVVDLNKIIRPDLTIIDGIDGMEGRGPEAGETKVMNILVSGVDVLSTDSVGTRIMGFDPRQIKYLKIADEQGLGKLDVDEILGEKIEDVIGNFKRSKKKNIDKIISSRIYNSIMYNSFIHKMIYDKAYFMLKKVPGLR